MTINKSKIWRYVEFAIVGLIGIIIVWKMFFQPLGNTQSEIYKEVSKYNDAKVKSLEGERDGYKSALVKTDTLISLIQQQQTLLQNQINNSQQIYNRLDAKINQIPIRIAAIAGNDDSIRAVFSNFDDQ